MENWVFVLRAIVLNGNFRKHINVLIKNHQCYLYCFLLDPRIYIAVYVTITQPTNIHTKWFYSLFIALNFKLDID